MNLTTHAGRVNIYHNFDSKRMQCSELPFARIYTHTHHSDGANPVCFATRICLAILFPHTTNIYIQGILVYPIQLWGQAKMFRVIKAILSNVCIYAHTEPKCSDNWGYIVPTLLSNMLVFTSKFFGMLMFLYAFHWNLY